MERNQIRIEGENFREINTSVERSVSSILIISNVATSMIPFNGHTSYS